MTRLYRDGFGVMHVVAWDDDSREWFHVCNVDRHAAGNSDEDKDDSDLPFTNCLRCLWRVTEWMRPDPDPLPFAAKTMKALST